MPWLYWMGFAGLLGGTGVGLGAFGAHALRSRLDERMLEVFETGVRYQMYHAFALAAVAFLASKFTSPLINSAGYCFLIGTIIFSASLYTLTLTGVRWLGAITPIGGVFLIVGWVLLAIACFKTAP